MKINKAFLITELILIGFYYLMILLSIIIQPINLILGFIIVFFLPGYNLLNIIKPDYSFIEKFGYSIIISLAIENVLMFLGYFTFYNFFAYPEVQTIGFIFNSKLLITTIIFLNLIFIIIKEYKIFKVGKESNEVQAIIKPILNFKKLKEIFNVKTIIILVIFGFSIVFLCISTIYSNVPGNDYLTNYNDYRADFTFFNRVPPVFYIFLFLSVISLILIIFVIKHKHLSLISISIFVYCLWILPYFQIGNYFSHDTYFLSRYYEIYLDYGIMTFEAYNFVIFNFDSLRYSTSLFTTILLIDATNCSLNFALWYLFPFLYISVAFLFYSIFNRFSKNKDNNYIILIIAVIFLIFTPQFSKYGHATGTGVFGIITYFILAVELFDLIKNRKFNKSNLFLIILLYFFLCLTRIEESIYFLILMVFSLIYYLFLEFKELNNIPFSDLDYKKDPEKKNSFRIFQIIQKDIKYRRVKKNFTTLGTLFLILILIFYFTQELFGYLHYYFEITLGRFSFMRSFFNIYLSSKVKIDFFLRGTVEISFFLINSIILGVLLMVFFLYFLFFNKFGFVLKVYNFGIKILKKFLNILIELTFKKFFQVLFFILSFSLITFININILNTTEEGILLTVITLVLSYSIVVMQVFFFIKGVRYYQLKNHTQNYYLISIMASSGFIIVFLMIGNLWLATYILHTKYISYFVFFGLIIIQDTYIKELKMKNFRNLIFIVILTLFLGIFYSLRTLAYG